MSFTVPPGTGLLRRRTKAVLLVVAALVGLGLVAADRLDAAGAFDPHLTNAGIDVEYLYPGDQVALAVGGPTQHTSTVRASFTLANESTVPLRVLALEMRGPGFVVLATRVGEAHEASPNRIAPGGRPLSPAEPGRLAPGARDRFSLDIRVDDCQAIGEPALRVTIDSWRGVRTVVVPVWRLVHHSSGWARVEQGGIGPLRYLADKLCGRS